GESLSTSQTLWLLWSAELEVRVDLSRDRLAELQTRALKNFKPGLVQANLYPYQSTGGAFLAEMFDSELGVLLADEMGLGKTMQAIYLLSHAATAFEAPSLVVAPSSTLANWLRELKRFAPSLTVLVHSGPQRTGDKRRLAA